MHCPICGFIMLMEVQDGEVTYTCVYSHPAGKATGVHMHISSETEALGPNVDLLLKWLKNPGT